MNKNKKFCSIHFDDKNNVFTLCIKRKNDSDMNLYQNFLNNKNDKFLKENIKCNM